MKQHESSQFLDWSILHRALFILGVNLALGTGLLLGSQQYYTYYVRWEMEQRNELGQVEAEYSRVQEASEMTTHSYYQDFDELRKKGFFQQATEKNLQEQRVELLTNVEKVIPSLKLPALANYELVAQLFTKIPFQIEPQLKVHETKLILTLGLLHEEDVLQLIEAVGTEQFKVKGLFNLQKCEIKRLQSHINVKEVSKPNLNAVCILAWYTSTLEKEKPQEVGRQGQSKKR